MPEGLDDARAAFAAEISPSAPLPQRDTGGRFTNSKPEPLFAERALEGDPLTGDVRDAGEDKRLAAIEKRVADGRAQEGDADALEREGRRLQDGAARPRTPGGDDGHRGAPAQQGERGPGEPEHEDEDAQGRDADGAAEGGEGDAEGASERDPEAAKWKVTYDGEPVEHIEVMVDGSPVNVTLGEAVQGYIRQAKYHQRMNQVDLARQSVEQEAQGAAQLRQNYIQQCDYLNRMIGELIPAQPDWDKEFAADPRAAHEKQKAYQAVYGKMQFLADQSQRAQAEARAEYDRNSQKYAVDQFSQFVAESQIPDEKTLQSEMALMRSYGKSLGFTEGELATVYDKRMLRVLRDAAKYNQGRAALPKAVIPGHGKTLKPGVASPLGNGARKSIDEAQTKLAKTGRLEDAAHVFARLIR
jgi:hypothetical protein